MDGGVPSLTPTGELEFDYQEPLVPIFWTIVFFVIALTVWSILITWAPAWFQKSYVDSTNPLLVVRKDPDLTLDKPKVFIVSFITSGVLTVIIWGVSSMW